MGLEKNDLQIILVDILKEFIKVCDKLGLKYYALGGTLLGVVRHNGFIPWDDDIDIGMFRDDYEIFLKEAPKYINKKFFLQTYISDEEYPQIFAKLRDSETTFIDKIVKNINMNHGVYIDIFPLDKLSDNKHIQRFNMLYFKLLREKLYNNLYFDADNRRGIKGRILNLLAKIILFNKNREEILESIEKLIRKYNSKDLNYIWNAGGAWGIKEIVNIEWFGEGIKKKFEGLDIVIPSDYDSYLRNIYGNYKELPPEEKRFSHHICEVIDLNKSYKEYVNYKK